MCINKDKTKAMTFWRSVQSDELTLSIHGIQVEYVQNFIYIGSMISWNNVFLSDSCISLLYVSRSQVLGVGRVTCHIDGKTANFC